MTDDRSPADDEIVSAYLDGEATADEVARVEGDPSLRARAAELRAVADQVGQVAPAPAAVRDRHLDRAREELLAAAPASAEVTHLATARARRSRAVVLGAVAAVLVIVLAAGLLPRLVDEEPEQLARVATSDEPAAPAEDPATALLEDEADADAGSGASPSTTLAGVDPRSRDADAGEAAPAGAPPPDLGTFGDRAELEAALAQAVDAHPPAGAAETFAVATTPCTAGVLGDDRELTDLVYAARAELAGQPVEVLLFRTSPASAANGPLRLYLVDPATCTPIADGVHTVGG